MLLYLCKLQSAVHSTEITETKEEGLFHKTQEIGVTSHSSCSDMRNGRGGEDHEDVKMEVSYGTQERESSQERWEVQCVGSFPLQY